MGDAIVAALITGAIALIGIIVSNAAAASKRREEQTAFVNKLFAKLDKNSELADEKLRGEINVIKTEISELRGEVQKHNGVIERVYKLEQDSAVYAERITTATHRIDEMEKNRAAVDGYSHR